MEDLTWLISEDKRREFDLKYHKLILSIPKALREERDYMPYWYTELPFPTIRKEFLDQLPFEYRKAIRDLYIEILKS